MLKKIFSKLPWTVVLALLNLGCGNEKAERVPDPTAISFNISPAESTLVVQLLERDERFQGLISGARVYLVGMEVFRDKNIPTAKNVLVTHYRPEGHLGIRSHVDLTNQTVVDVTGKSGNTVPLSGEEYQLAKNMVLRSADARRVLGSALDSVTLEGALTRVSDEKATAQHRVVVIWFKTEAGYIVGISARVDLIAGTVEMQVRDIDPDLEVQEP